MPPCRIFQFFYCGISNFAKIARLRGAQNIAHNFLYLNHRKQMGVLGTEFLLSQDMTVLTV
jgi:hypothetical protein